MTETTDPRKNRFEHHPKVTLLVVCVGLFLILDVLTAHTYRWIVGYRWCDRYLEARRRQSEIVRSYRAPSDIYHHDLAKNVSLQKTTWGEIGYPIRTNSLGFRDDSVRQVALVSANHRVVLMGDSFLEGMGFDLGLTVAGRVTEALAQDGVEVLNAAVASYSPIIYWKKTEHLLQTVGLRFDEMIVFLDISDVQDEARFHYLDDEGHVQQKEDAPSYVAIGLEGLKRTRPIPVEPEQESPLLAVVKGAFKDHSIVLYTILNTARDTLAGGDARPRLRYAVNLTRSLWTIDERVYAAYGELGVTRMQTYMDKLLHLLRRYNAKLTVVVYPWPDQVMTGDLASKHVTLWREWCRDRDVPCLNLFPEFVDGLDEKERKAIIDRYFIRGDVHWNAQGNQLVADKFLQFYRQGLH